MGFFEKYLQLDSLTFWIGVIQIILGTSMAVTAGFDELTQLNKVLVELGGGMSAYQYITGGFALITLRAAMK